jgi:hypothetical protein
MSMTNPTQLHQGATGVFNGRNYRVAGRVVMSVVDGGQFYYWNEFQLETGNNENSILVYEETRRGGEWRFFNRFEPRVPLSIAEAAKKAVGDWLNLDGTDVCVTFVGGSQVSHIEGWAPKTEFAGKEEKYFNAEAGSKMIVVSYTPQEIEFYSGQTIPGSLVESAFHIPKPPRSAYALSRYGGSSDSDNSFKLLLLGILMFPVLLFAFASCNGVTTRAPAVRVFAAQNFPAVAGGSVALYGTNNHIDRDNVVEITEQGLRFGRHEFSLVDAEGNQALLLGGLHPEGGDWCLMSDVTPDNPPTPQQAGDIEPGKMLRVGTNVFTVSELFLCNSPAQSYGFIAKSGSNVLIARWSEFGIAFQCGAMLSPEAIRSFTKQFAGK